MTKSIIINIITKIKALISIVDKNDPNTDGICHESMANVFPTIPTLILI